jgi:glycosyltransferase involved in cell wall biosynthesis
LACASPIIAYDVPFNREVARDASLYFSNEKKLAEEIRALESNRQERARMGARVERIALREYSVAEVLERYTEILSES